MMKVQSYKGIRGNKNMLKAISEESSFSEEEIRTPEKK